MSWEMAMTGFFIDAPYIAAILGATVAVVTLGIVYLKDLQVKMRFYQYAADETESALVSADRVLKNGATPREVRSTLLCMLEAMADRDLGRDFVRHFVASQGAKKKRPGSDNPLSEAMDKLHASHPELAADAHNALMGVILTLPLMHADKVKVSEIVALEYVGEGATNPANVFDRASKALSSFDHKSGSSHNNGLATA